MITDSWRQEFLRSFKKAENDKSNNKFEKWIHNHEDFISNYIGTYLPKTSEADDYRSDSWRQEALLFLIFKIQEGHSKVIYRL